MVEVEVEKDEEVEVVEAESRSCFGRKAGEDAFVV